MSALLCRFADPELVVASHHADAWHADLGCIEGDVARLSSIVNTLQARDDDEVSAHDTFNISQLRHALAEVLLMAQTVERRA
jgi:hypothetical protein